MLITWTCRIPAERCPLHRNTVWLKAGALGVLFTVTSVMSRWPYSEPCAMVFMICNTVPPVANKGQLEVDELYLLQTIMLIEM